MKAVHNPATPAITQIVTPAKPETFDLIGLNVEQMACLVVLTGVASGGYGSAIYEPLLTALGLDNDDVYEIVKDFEACHVSESIVKKILAKR